MSADGSPLRLVAVSAGTGSPSTTRMLVDQAVAATVTRLRTTQRAATTHVIELAPIAREIADSLVSGYSTADVRAAIEQLANADGLIVSTPVYKARYQRSVQVVRRPPRQ